MKYKKLRAIIERRAKSLARDEINRLKKSHKDELKRIRLAAEDDSKYFRDQDERREKIYLQRRDYIDNKRIRTEKECQEIIEDAEAHADITKTKARKLLIEAISINNKVQNAKTEIQGGIATLQGVSTQVAVQSDQSDSAAHDAEHALRKIK